MPIEASFGRPSSSRSASARLPFRRRSRLPSGIGQRRLANKSGRESHPHPNPAVRRPTFGTHPRHPEHHGSRGGGQQTSWDNDWETIVRKGAAAGSGNPIRPPVTPPCRSGTALPTCAVGRAVGACRPRRKSARFGRSRDALPARQGQVASPRSRSNPPRRQRPACGVRSSALQRRLDAPALPSPGSGGAGEPARAPARLGSGVAPTIRAATKQRSQQRPAPDHLPLQGSSK